MEFTDETVIQNSDTLYKKDVKWIDTIEPQPINDYEKDMLKNTFKPDELIMLEKSTIIDTIPLTDTNTKNRRDYITKVKLIALDMIGKPLMYNTSFLPLKLKNELLDRMREIMSWDDTKITTKFNELCTDKLFHPTSEFWYYPVYDA